MPIYFWYQKVAVMLRHLLSLEPMTFAGERANLREPRVTRMVEAILVGLFGLIGVFSRWGLDCLAGKWLEIFPIGILSINVLGSFLAGIVYVLGTERAAIPPHLSVGLLVGFCGGFTTFSSFTLQSFLYLEKGDLFWWGLGYAGLSPLFGLLGVFLGISLARTCA